MDSHETQIYTAILIAASIVGIIVIYFIVSIIRNQQRLLKIHQSSLKIEITTLENERRRIVSDLHDELGPLLSVVKFQVISLETSDTEDLRLIEKAAGGIDDVLHRIREICNHLMPQVLIRKGLLTAVAEFVSELDGKTSIKMEFTGQDVSVPANAEIHIYRMIQEIVQNAIKHSGASSLHIHIGSKSGKLLISVTDNGIGFSPDRVAMTGTGYGLKNIFSRVEILRGEMYLASEPNKGTTYTIEIPYA